VLAAGSGLLSLMTRLSQLTPSLCIEEKPSFNHVKLSETAPVRVSCVPAAAWWAGLVRVARVRITIVL
jgi:hypothetical protein